MVTMKKNSYGLEVNKRKLIWGSLTDNVNNQFYLSPALFDKVLP